ncbi:MAG: hypothetical protein HY801_00365 [Candidatus Lindowbacteria bacterium]|nr:hypothetical protein [Candidatus Lindowbacteria bacterium]
MHEERMRKRKSRQKFTAVQEKEAEPQRAQRVAEENARMSIFSVSSASSVVNNPYLGFHSFLVAEEVSCVMKLIIAPWQQAFSVILFSYLGQE